MMYSVRLDEIAEAVDIAIASLVKPVSQGGLGEKAGNELKKLVKIRYLVDPMPTLDQQLRRLKYKSKITYFAKLHQLHNFMSWKLNNKLGNNDGGTH